MSLIVLFANISISSLVGIGGPTEEVKVPNIVQSPVIAQAQEAPVPSEPVQPPEVKVVVQKGDSLSKIANAHQTTWPRLYDANANVEHPDIINPGEEIRIPKAEEQLTSRPLPTPAPTSAPAASPQSVKRSKPAVATSYTPVGDGSVWDSLAKCESGGRWNINTGNGYYGGLQFSASTWRSVGGSGLASEASREEQIARAAALQARSGWGQWPACSSKLGLR